MMKFCTRVQTLANVFGLQTAALDVKNYLTQVKTANRDKTELLLKKLIAAFATVSVKLNCLSQKLNRLNYLSSQCAIGANTIEYLVIEALKSMSHDIKACPNNVILPPKANVLKYAQDSMIAVGKETDCVLNSATKKKLVCASFSQDVSDQVNAVNNKVTLAQVKWFISRCPPADVTSAIKRSICDNRHLGKTEKEILALFHKYNSVQVTETYNKCPKPTMTSITKALICTKKDQGYTHTAILNMKEFTKSNPIEVINVFKTCPKPQIKSHTVKMICNLKANGIKLNEKMFSHLKLKYGDNVIADVYAKCPAVVGKKGDSGNEGVFFR